jgi:hypothetical protein
MDNLQNKRCLIGMPNGSGFISAYVVDGLFKLERPLPVSLIIVERQSVIAARNYMIELAIKMQVDYLFFIDDDGVLAADTLVKMLEDDKDVVVAPILTRNESTNGKHKLCCFEKFDFYIGDGKNIKKYRAIESFDQSKGYLQPIDAAGGACMLIKKNVFEALFLKHNGRPFDEIHEVLETKEHGVTLRNLSEDVTFHERVKEEGFELWVDLRIRPVHLGKPKFVQFKMEGEDLPDFKNEVKGATLLSENLKSIELPKSPNE